MNEIATIQSSKITWKCFPADPETDGADGLVNEYCADGDGIVVVLESVNGHFYLVDQLEDIADLGTNKIEALENAQNYLAATYNEIYQLAKF